MGLNDFFEGSGSVKCFLSKVVLKHGALSSVCFISGFNGKDNGMAAKIDKEKCTGCGICEDVCPTDAIIVNGIASADEEKCVDCGTCVDECPNEAITIN